MAIRRAISEQIWSRDPFWSKTWTSTNYSSSGFYLTVLSVVQPLKRSSFWEVLSICNLSQELHENKTLLSCVKLQSQFFCATQRNLFVYLKQIYIRSISKWMWYSCDIFKSKRGEIVLFFLHLISHNYLEYYIYILYNAYIPGIVIKTSRDSSFKILFFVSSSNITIRSNFDFQNF